MKRRETRRRLTTRPDFSTVTILVRPGGRVPVIPLVHGTTTPTIMPVGLGRGDGLLHEAADNIKSGMPAAHTCARRTECRAPRRPGWVMTGSAGRRPCRPGMAGTTDRRRLPRP